jgi:hypothetical protein
MYEVPIFESPTTPNVISQSGRAQFPDPWCDYASSELPRSLISLLRWGIKLWYSNGIYRSAMERAARYFITNPIFDGDSEAEAAKYRELFTKQIDFSSQLGLLGADFVAVGNSFSSLFIPFARYLVCPSCGIDRPLHQVNYEWQDFQFVGKCGKCHRRVTFKWVDRRISSRENRIKVIRWNPIHMVLQHNPFSDETEYRYRIPPVYRDAIRRGDPLFLSGTPWAFIECVKNDKLFKFHKNKVFHMREEPLAGVHTAGWGMPRFVSNFRQAYYNQIMHRYNEAIAMDFIVPTRVTFPRADGPADVTQTMNMGIFKNQVLEMFAQQRKDPASWHFLPFPIEYATLGGEGNKLAADEMLNAGNTELLDGIGIPMEMHRGTLNAQAMPTALRMFQQLWYHVPAQYSAWLQWSADQVAELRNWMQVKASMQPVTQADDMEKKQVLLQLASANKVSMSTALSPFGIEVRREMEQMYAEQRMQGELERDFQQKMQEQAEVDQRLQQLEQAKQMPQGGMPGAPGAPQGAAPGMPTPMAQGGAAAQATPQSPQELLQQAEQMAQQLLQMPEAQRKSELINLKRSDEALHAVVKSKMQTIRQGAALQGREMVLSGQGQPM